MNGSLWLTVLFMCFLCCMCLAAEEGLVGHWRFGQAADPSADLSGSRGSYLTSGYACPTMSSTIFGNIFT